MRKNEKITALYERLSRDDFGKDDDQQRESKCCSPPASLEKQILKIRPLTGRNVRKVDGLFLSQKSKKGGQSQ